MPSKGPTRHFIDRSVEASLDLLSGGGEMGALIRAFDWSRTPIGAPETWSPAMRMMLRVLLANRFPMLLWWGPDYIQLYNDAYRPVPGAKHPQSLGQPGSECWSEIWHILRPLVDTPFNGGPATWIEDLELELRRAGFPEETHFTIAYSPVPDDTAPGGIGGVLATVHEITEKVIGERRIVILRDLGTRAAEAKTAEEACAVAAATLARHSKDIPFALLYLTDPDHNHASLSGVSGVEEGPAVIELDEGGAGSAVWPLAAARRTGQVQVVSDISSWFTAPPLGPWADPPHAAAVVPIRSNIAHQLSGFLVAGLSSRLKFDDSYQNFLELAAGQIATAIANARAHEEERKRAEALAEIDRAKTTFFSNVSHEFRTPLTLMLGSIEGLIAKPGAGLPPDNRELLDVAHRNSLRLLKLVNSLLDFSRIEAGRIQASYTPVNLAMLTVDLVSNFRSAMQAGGLDLAVDCPPLPEPVFIDRDMWEKIVLNLLSNAFKFTLEGSVTVRLRACGDHAVLTVSDTGAGIPETELPRIFERFHRVEGVKGRSYEGAGIGLALIQELVKLHGGGISASSRIGEGSTFTVSLPFGKAHLPAERIASQAAPVSTAIRAEAFTEEASTWSSDVDIGHEASTPEQDRSGTERRGRILLADDNADMRRYLARVLSARFDVEAVADGIAALAAASEWRPDLILSDVMMPRLDGFGLVKQLRAAESTRAIPVILLSARAAEESRLEALGVGADDYLVKPFSAREVLARVESHLKLARFRMEIEQRITTVLESVTDGFQVIDSNWRLTYMNGAARRMFAAQGSDPDALIGKHFLNETFPEARRTGIDREFNRAMTERVPIEFENFYEPWQRWYAVRAFPVAGAGMSVFFQDITLRKESEEALRKTRERLGALIDSAPLGVLVIDPQMNVRLWNTAAETLFGWTEAEVLGRGVPFVPEDRLPEWGACRDTVLRGEISSLQTQRRKRSGSLVEVSLTAAPLRDKDGDITEILVLIKDITARKEAEEALRDSERRLASMVDSIDQLAWMANADGETFWYNKRWYEYTGATRAEMEGWGWQSVHDPDVLPEVVEKWTASIRTGQPFDMVFPLRGVNGEFHPFLTRVHPVRDRNGAVIRWFGTNTDITAQRAIEMELRRANEDLTQFAFAASHDLQEPLRAIISYSQLLVKGYRGHLQGEASMCLEHITEGAKRMRDLLADLLAYTQLTRDGQPMEPVDLNWVFKEVVENCKASIEESHAVVTSERLPTIPGHPPHFLQLFQNLIGNAIKYRGAEAPRVHISAEVRNGAYRFGVTDNGMGIDPKYHHRIFGVFKRLHGKTIPGTGIGLAICQRVVERYGGRIWVESEVNRGAAFYFTLPSAKGASA